MVKSLRLFQPKLTNDRRRAAEDEQRGNRHDRGYDNEWAAVSAEHLRRNPLCAECEHHGRTVLADVVDHKIPVKDAPELRLDPRNLWSLCHFCHNGIKRRMEAYARVARLVAELILWCDDPKSRPKTFRIGRGPEKEEYIV